MQREVSVAVVKETCREELPLNLVVPLLWTMFSAAQTTRSVL